MREYYFVDTLIWLIYYHIYYGRELSRKKYPKYPDYKYFDPYLAAAACTETDIAYQSFILHYSTFVVNRIRNFSPMYVANLVCVFYVYVYISTISCIYYILLPPIIAM
jgi:hypothetical protein